jgi:hypothetical protein
LRLIKDRKAHTAAPQYQEVLDGLQDGLRKRQNIVEREYALRLQAANHLVAAERDRIESSFHVSSIPDLPFSLSFSRASHALARAHRESLSDSGRTKYDI